LIDHGNSTGIPYAVGFSMMSIEAAVIVAAIRPPGSHGKDQIRWRKTASLILA
jgi:hypothetical protein